MPFEHNCNHPGTCDHEPAAEDSLQCSLYSRIDLENVQCLNETVDGSCRKIIRPWEDRLSREHSVESDSDQDLLFNIPFSGTVKLKSLVLIGPDDQSHPFSVKLYKNKPFMTYDMRSLECDQEVSLARDPEGRVAYPLKAVKFGSVSHLSIYIPRNYGNDDDLPTTVYYLGLNGEFQGAHKQQALITNYESQANPADHKLQFTQHVFKDVL